MHVTVYRDSDGDLKMPLTVPAARSPATPTVTGIRNVTVTGGPTEPEPESEALTR